MVKRFIKRFKLWRRECADEFEDKFVAWLLFFAVLVVTIRAYSQIMLIRSEMLNASWIAKIARSQPIPKYAEFPPSVQKAVDKATLIV